jgi:hypothetical protein
MVPEPLITANEVLIAVTVFTTGFLSVRIHGERLRVLERRDAERDKLIEAMSSGQAILRINAPSAAEFDLANVGKSLLFVNLGILLMLLTLQLIAGRTVRWVWGWPPDAEFWFFAAVDIIESVLIIIAFIDWYAVRNDLARDDEKRPWPRLNAARTRVQEAIGMPLDEPKRAEQLDDASADLLGLNFAYRTWLEPLVLSVLVDWLRSGAQYAADQGTQEEVVSLLPDEPAPRLALAHILTSAWASSSDKSSPDKLMLERARSLAEEAIAKAHDRSLPQEVLAAGQEAAGDTFLVEHHWHGAIAAYEIGLLGASLKPLGYHRQRNRVKLALTLIGKHVHSLVGAEEAVQRARVLLEGQARVTEHDYEGNVISRAPIGLHAALAVVYLLVSGIPNARATIKKAISSLNAGTNEQNSAGRL